MDNDRNVANIKNIRAGAFERFTPNSIQPNTPGNRIRIEKMKIQADDPENFNKCNSPKYDNENKEQRENENIDEQSTLGGDEFGILSDLQSKFL